MKLYALTIFTSAFLLFLIQPIIAKQILPWFGGSAAVWATCLVFFQCLLLFGYAYTDWTTRKLKPRTQVTLHVALLALSIASLPIIPDAAWKPDGDNDPTWRILGLLTATIGLPYFLLSTTGPLVQAWFARTFTAGTVYRLFALSNFGSLLALIAYPFAVEPWITGPQQSYAWTAGYAAFALLCSVSAIYSVRRAYATATGAGAVPADRGPAPRARDYMMWLLLSAMGSFMLLGVTNHITHDVAAVPFLWILPLTLYLITFILCFEGSGWYQRRIFLAPLFVVVIAMAWALHADGGIMDIKGAIPLYATGLFVCCMFFHGELAAMKPSPRYLTTFYLMVSLGGALGSLVIGFAAPRFFNSHYEFGIGLVITLALAACLTWQRLPRLVPLAALGAACFTAFHVYQYVDLLSRDTRVMVRNFYGTLRVKDGTGDNGEDPVRRLMHGVIMHGEQYLAPGKQALPTTYYGPDAGVARIIKARLGDPVRIGVVGLGAGTLAVYGRPGDLYRFYEINPQVVQIARSEFTFLGASGAEIETVLGDARLNMEREPPQAYDVLVIDAFSSDSIPVHLITREAMAVYLRHMKPDGVIAFHVTNRFLKLAPVVKRISEAFDLHTVLVADEAEDSEFSKTDWVLASRNRALLEREDIAKGAESISDIPGLRIWTDDYNNLFRILK